MNNSTKAIETIYFHAQDIFIDGQVVASITDFYVKYEDCEKYRTTAQMLVNRVLNYPDTAKYLSVSGWAFALEDGIVTTPLRRNLFSKRVDIKSVILYHD